MFQFRFNQKLSLGFGLVLLIVLIGGLLFLTQLNQLNNASARVNDAAVALSKKAHGSELKLLKLVKLSSLAVNAPDKDSVLSFKQQFEQDSAEFMSTFRELISLSSVDENINVLVIAVSTNYDLYRYSVREMFDAQLHFFEVQTQGKALSLAQRAQLKGSIQSKLNEADAAAIQAIMGFDELLDYLDQRYLSLKNALFRELEFGFQSGVAALVIAILLCTQIFNLLRMAIQSQRRDLVTLTEVGSKLAYSQNYSMALEELLGCLHEQIGVTQGSVYLMNDANKLEVNSHFPPKHVSHNNKAALFEIGEGLIGKAALSKKIIYVPNTSKDKVFIERNSLQNAAGTGNELYSDQITYRERALICVPLLDKDLLVGVLNLSGESSQVKLEDSDYEFIASLAQSLVTSIKNIRAREVLEERNHGLELQVRDRAEALEEAHRGFGHMLESLPVGVFSIGKNGLIHEDYASSLEDILETDHIAGRSFADLLFSHASGEHRLIDQNITAVHAILGSELSNFRAQSEHLLTELTIILESGNEKTLSLTWEPIHNKAGQVEKLVVCLNDLSEFSRARAYSLEQKRKFDVLSELLASRADNLAPFLAQAQESLAQSRDLLLANRKKDLNVITQLYSTFTMLKDRARVIGLSQLGMLMAELEASYAELIRNETLAWRVDPLLSDLDQANHLIALYAALLAEQLNGSDCANDEASMPVIAPQLLQDSLGVLAAVAREQPMSEEAKAALKGICERLMALDPNSSHTGITTAQEVCQQLARQFGKAVPTVTASNFVLAFKPPLQTIFNEALLQVCQYCLKHSIESPEIRGDLGKASRAEITLALYEVEGGLVLVVSDDGAGLMPSLFSERDARAYLAEPAALASNDKSTDYVFNDERFNDDGVNNDNSSKADLPNISPQQVQGAVAYSRVQMPREFSSLLAQLDGSDITLSLELASDEHSKGEAHPSHHRFLLNIASAAVLSYSITANIGELDNKGDGVS